MIVVVLIACLAVIGLELSAVTTMRRLQADVSLHRRRLDQQETALGQHETRMDALATQASAAVATRSHPDPAPGAAPDGTAAVAGLGRRLDELSARLDVARAAVRRAERRVAELKAAGDLADDTVLTYLNRLSDAVYAMARFADEPEPELFEGRG